MENTVSVDLEQVARDVGLPITKVQPTVELLDDGNTVPFITRYRKDQTGGLDEEQIRCVQDSVAKLRALADRKQRILKTLQSQGKLTEELAERINRSDSLRRVEDLYQPFKSKKQTLASLARSRGLEPLAREILEGGPAVADLRGRAEQYVNEEQDLPTATEVLQGAGHLIAEQFSENISLRDELRKFVKNTGILVASRIEEAAAPSPGDAVTAETEADDATAGSDELALSEESTPADEMSASEPPAPPTEESPSAQKETPPAPEPAASAGGVSAGDQSPAPPAHVPKRKLTVKQIAAQQRKEAKRRKRQKKIEAFKDYFDFREPLAKIPPHRLLALNRGERSKILRVRVDVDTDAMAEKARQMLVPTNHPHAEFLCGCMRDALARLVVPSLERDVRRELTDKAEAHAVRVFARNLRKLLLQPPVRDRRVLAVDPGFRSGCKLAALDEFGSVLGHTVIHVIGKEDVVRRGRQQIVEMITLYHIPVIAIGNGSASRETEKLIAHILANELASYDVQYVMVNEAGASVYSTSPLGREELPRFDPVLRSAISIGRRLQDPLSELVKINPANIGVGLYQHDVKAKHLEVSLDAVVESCVNFVGVDVNTASPSLMRYVSGLNQLTARRLYEYRQQHGPFRNRNQFKELPGFGDATFVQAAGFLRITNGDNPLDATWIHPESYEAAERVIEELGSSVSELAACVAKPQEAEGAGPSQPMPQPESIAKQEEPSEQPPEEPDTGSEADRAGSAESPDDPHSQQAEAVEVPNEPPETAVVTDEPSDSTENAVGNGEEDEPADSVNAAEKPLTLAERAANADVPALAARLNIGELLLRDILVSITRPGRDPREDLPSPTFRREVMKLDDIRPEMEFCGTVLNVVDFGAFVDIGLPDSGLIHISRLADRYVRDPHEVVSVGDILTVWVVDVDKQRRRVSLTAIKPGTETSREERRDKSRPARRDRQTRKPEGKPRGRRAEGKQQGRHAKGGKPKYERRRPRKKKAPAPPITDAMVEGKEPMRSFSDLLQFYERKSTDDEEEKS